MSKMTFKMTAAVLAAIAWCALCVDGIAQSVTPGLPVQPLGYCQMTSTTTAANISTCTRASFTGTGSGTTLTVTALTGKLLAGDPISGTGVPAGTTIVSQLTSVPAGATPGGNGTYQTSQATTSSSNALTSTGVPLGATLAVIEAETVAIRFRDDGGTPTTAVGFPIAAAAAPYTYAGTLTALQFIAQSTTGTIDFAFYKSP